MEVAQSQSITTIGLHSIEVILIPPKMTTLNVFTSRSNKGFDQEDNSTVIKISCGTELSKKGA